MRAQTLILSRRIRGREGYGGHHMTQPKRICSIGAIVFLILLSTALATHALTSVTSLTPVKAMRDQGLPQAWFFGQDTGAARSPAMVCALVIDAPIAQSEIPNVLVPSTIPSAEPSLPTASPTPQPAAASTNGTNGTSTDQRREWCRPWQGYRQHFALPHHRSNSASFCHRSLVLFLFHGRSRSRGSERRKRGRRSIRRRRRRYRVERTQVSLGLIISRLPQTGSATALIMLQTVQLLHTKKRRSPPMGIASPPQKTRRRPLNGYFCF